MSWAEHTLLRLQRWLPRRWRLMVDTLPPPGTPQAAARCSTWAVAWASHTGPHHLNQDCAGARWCRIGHGHGHGLAAAVADGVTQGAAGDVAARALVEHWLQGPRLRQGQPSFLGAAEAAVAGALRQFTPEPGAATGAACWLQPDGSGWATRVGDCRLLRLTPPAKPWATAPWAVQPLLPDQTYGNLWHQGLGPAPHGDDAQQPAHMVGVGKLGEPEWIPLTLGAGELLLLVSDGLHSALSDDDWQAVLGSHFSAGPSQWRDPARPECTLLGLARLLIQTAIQRGSEDDITVLAVGCCTTSAQQEQPVP